MGTQVIRRAFGGELGDIADSNPSRLRGLAKQVGHLQQDMVLGGKIGVDGIVGDFVGQVDREWNLRHPVAVVVQAQGQTLIAGNLRVVMPELPVPRLGLREDIGLVLEALGLDGVGERACGIGGCMQQHGMEQGGNCPSLAIVRYQNFAPPA